MGYVPDLHKIWVGTSDQQLMALSNEFPAGPVASAMAVRSGWLQKLSTRAGCGTQGIGVGERSVQPPHRAHQAACRLIVETDDGNFWGSGLQPHIRTHDFLALSICAVLPLPP